MSKRKLAAVVFSVLVGLSGVASAQTGDFCNRPWPVVVPNGLTATKAELVETQRGVKKYMEGGDAYLACLKREEDLVPEDPYANTEELADIRARKHNAMFDEMEVVAARFNQALAEFNQDKSSESQ